VNPTTSYQRLLVHRCSAYYRLGPENDPTSKGITVYPTTDSKMYVGLLLPENSNSYATRVSVDPLGASPSLSHLKKLLNPLSK